jgi:hypothetical protein
MKEWFYMKNDLKVREDIKDIKDEGMAALRTPETKGRNGRSI